MGKSNKRDSVKSNRRGPPRVKNRDSNEATGITVEEVIEKIETLIAPAPTPKKTIVDLEKTMSKETIERSDKMLSKMKKTKTSKGEGK